MDGRFRRGNKDLLVDRSRYAVGKGRLDRQGRELPGGGGRNQAEIGISRVGRLDCVTLGFHRGRNRILNGVAAKRFGKVDFNRFARRKFKICFRKRIGDILVESALADVDSRLLELQFVVGSRRRERKGRLARGALGGDDAQRALRHVVRNDDAHIGDLIRFDREVFDRIRYGLAGFRVYRRSRRVVDRMRRRVFHRGDHVVAVHDVTEDVVAVVEPIGRIESDIELSVARIRPGVGKRDDSAGAVRQQIGMFVGDRTEFGTFETVAVARTALEHKVFDDAVERQAFVVVVVHELHESRAGIGRFAFGTEELNDDFAERRNDAFSRRLHDRERDLVPCDKGSGEAFNRTRVDEIERLAFVRVMIGIGVGDRDHFGQRFIEGRRVEHLALFQSFEDASARRRLQVVAAPFFADFREQRFTG